MIDQKRLDEEDQAMVETEMTRFMSPAMHRKMLTRLRN